MRMSWRDRLATLFVGIGALLYALWLAGVQVGGLTDVAEIRVLGGIIFGLGLAASVIAVVYGVGAGLLKASKGYLAIASLLGIAALVAGIALLVTANDAWLGTLMAATAVLWLMSTIRHATMSVGESAVTVTSSDASLPKAA